MIDAIDVSKHQGRFDWQAAYNKGIRHAMLRVFSVKENLAASRR